MVKSSVRVSLALALGMVTTCVSGSSLDRLGVWTPTEFHAQAPPAGVRALINDGSFELGPPPGSAWTETSSSTCERIGDFSGTWYVSPYDGAFDYWAGGYCENEETHLNEPVTGSVSQTVFVPTDNTTLSFYYVSFRPEGDDDPPDGDRLYLSVNGNEIWTLELTQANSTYPDWAGPVMVDLGAYSGEDVELAFGGVSVGDVTGNARVDYIELRPDPAPVESHTWGRVKALYF